MSSALTEARPARRTAVGALVLVVLAGIAVGGWRWSHPDLFADRGQEVTFDNVSLAAPEVYGMVGIGPERPDQAETIALGKVTAHFARNRAHATVRFDVCTERPGAGQIGSLRAGADLTEYCSELRPVRDGVRLHIYPEGSSRPLEYVLMTLVPTTTGTSHVDAVTFSYARSGKHLFQQGNDRSNQDWIVRVGP